VACRLLDDFEQERLVYEVSAVPREVIPLDVKTAFYRMALLGDAEVEPLGRYGAPRAADMLGQVGGVQAGVMLSAILFRTPNSGTAETAARALGTIEDYDAVPSLVEALGMPGAREDAIAQALGTIADARAIPALKQAARGERLDEQDRLWIAAALARLGQDYAENAAIIRAALPRSLEQAGWLRDDESIRAIGAFVGQGIGSVDQAALALERIGTTDALEILADKIELGVVSEPAVVREVAEAAQRIAERLDDSSQVRWAQVATVAGAVRDSFAMMQRIAPMPRENRPPAVMATEPALARRLWIAEANRILDVAAREEGTAYRITDSAVLAIEPLFASELVPTFERISKEDREAASIQTVHGFARHYHVRSLAARILTERTGRPYTFVDVDGRTHPGGWDPSQEP
jgi:hypothetical protein